MYMEVDGKSQGKSNLKTYSAHKNNVSARLEEYDLVGLFIKVNNRTQDYVLKVDHAELLVLREVLNMWHKEHSNETT